MKRKLSGYGMCYACCLALWLGACFAQPTSEATSTTSAPIVLRREENPYAPRPGDVSRERAEVVLTSLDLSEFSGVVPLRSELTILGSMPSVCNELRIRVKPPDSAYRIYIEIYSIVNSSISCENVFQQFETSIVLAEYSPGQYSIWVNNTFVGDIVSY